MQAEFFDKNKIDNIKLSDGLIVDLELITKNMSAEGRKKYNEALNISRLKQLCEEKKGVKVLVMPINDDFYGMTEIIEENHDSLCYTIIDNKLGLNYLHKENVSLGDINDYYLLEAGRSAGANIVFYGLNKFLICLKKQIFFPIAP